MTNEDTVRAEFEAWFLREIGRPFQIDIDASYWTTWRAARVAPPAGVEAHGVVVDGWGAYGRQVQWAHGLGPEPTTKVYLAAAPPQVEQHIPQESSAHPETLLGRLDAALLPILAKGYTDAESVKALVYAAAGIGLRLGRPQVEQQTAGADSGSVAKSYVHSDEMSQEFRHFWANLPAGCDAISAAWHAWNRDAPSPRAEEAAPTGAAPAGWKLVPIEPTQDMLDEAWNAAEGSGDTASIKAAIRAGIAAAPACDSLVVALPGLPFGRDWLRATFPLSDAEADDILRAMNIVVKADHEALFDQLTDQQQFIHDLREALGVEYEPHQHLHERMLDAARSRPVASTTDAASVLRFAAKTIELFDDAAMTGDHMLSSTECASILAALETYPFAPITTPEVK